MRRPDVHCPASSRSQGLRNPRKLVNGSGNASTPQLLQTPLHLNALVCLAQQSDGYLYSCKSYAAPLDLKWGLHPILLAGWGTPIGELFDLELLAKTCKRLKRWTFFFVSIPLNYTGAVASPPNAMAIF